MAAEPTFTYDPWKRVFQIVLAVLVLLSAAQMGSLRSRGRAHANDFKHLWAGTRVLAQGGSPYDRDLLFTAARQSGFSSVNPYVYLPSTGLILRPIAALEFRWAELVWFWLNFVLAWGCVLAGPRLLKVENERLAQLAGAAFLLGSLPFLRQMTAGQMNVVLLAALVGALGLLARQRDLEAGALIGFAAAFKIAPLFLILALAGMRRYRAAGSAAGVFAVFVVLSALWAGWDVLADSIPVIGSMRYGSSTWSDLGIDFYRQPFNQSFNSFFHHLLTENPHSTPWLSLGPRVANLATVLVSLALLWAMTRAIRRYRRRPYFRAEWGQAETGLFLLATLVMLLLPSLMWDHYCVQALAALAWVFGVAQFRRRPLAGIGALIVFLALAYPVVHGHERWKEGPGLFMMSLRLWGTLGLLALVHGEWMRAMRRRWV